MSEHEDLEEINEASGRHAEAAILRKVSVHVAVGSMAVTRPNRVFAPVLGQMAMRTRQA